MDRDAILCVDGQEILNYGRQAIPTYIARHRINSGAFGTMGVGMPFGLGAKVASPDKQVIVLHGDGSFGMNAMEFDTAVRHKVPILVVISLNGGWTARPEQGEAGPRPRLSRATTSSPRRSAATASMSSSRRRSARRCCGRWSRWVAVCRRW